MAPILIHLHVGGSTIVLRSYQLFIGLGVLLGLLTTYRALRRTCILRPAAAFGLMVALLSAGFLGARSHFLLNSSRPYTDDLRDFLNLAGGGLHAPGGVVAVFLVGSVLSRSVGLRSAALADAVAPSLGIAMALVRVGCLLNGCCFGTPCTFPWCIAFPRTSYVFLLHAGSGLVLPDASHSAPVHPLQLYFAAAALTVFGVGLWTRRRRRYEGQVALRSLSVFWATTAPLEFLRADYEGRVYWGPLPALTWSALALAAASLAWLLAAQWRHQRLADATA